MRSEERLPEDIQDALRKGLLKRLPLTFHPFINQSLREWDHLFPQERQSVGQLIVYVGGLSEEESSRLFRDVMQLEEMMGVRHWPQFSTSEQTIENSSLLARSPYFQEWRRAVQAVFDVAEQRGPKTDAPGAQSQRRLVLLVIPRPLPVDPAKVWRKWQGIGRPLKLDLAASDDTPSPGQLLLGGIQTALGHAGGLLDVAVARAGAASADTWVCDAGSHLSDYILEQDPSRARLASVVLLAYGRLAPFRESFAHEMNTMRKDLADADAVYDRLRKVDVSPWCPPEVVEKPAVREFLRALYLNGNGALIYGNSFVEWAASESFRRARPCVLVAHFGVRSKPKPFTSVVLFENADKLNPLPSVDDLPGSAVDAEMLALYVWLAALRYEEYRRSTVCVCLAETISEAYVVAPQDFALASETARVPLNRLSAALCEWITEDLGNWRSARGEC